METASSQPATPFGSRFAAVLRAEARTLTRKWLEELEKRLRDVPRRRIFPTASLLNHIPQVLETMAEFVEAESADVRSDFVVRDLEHLARLRRRQGYDLAEIQSEFSILANLLFEVADKTALVEPVPPANQVISVLHRLHEALRQVTSTTSLSYGEAASEDRLDRAVALERFGRVIAHEMRNRLNFARLSMAGWKHNEDQGVDVIETLKKAIDSALAALEDLADDVQALALAQATQESSWARRRPLSEVVEGIIESARPLAEARKVELITPKDLPKAAVDATRLELALVNLLVNALRHLKPSTDKGRVEVTVDRAEADDSWVLEVIDNGSGIPEDLRRSIFDEGVRGPEADALGSGLGLAIARDAMETLGGMLSLESGTARGSVFRMVIPDPPESWEGTAEEEE